MKSKIKLTQEFICKLPSEMQDNLAVSLEGVDNPDELHVHRKSIDDDPQVMEVENSEKRLTIGYASTRTLDRDGEIIVPGGMDLAPYRKNPVLLWSHNWGEQPIGKMPDIASDGFGLRGISEYATTKLATDIWTLVKGAFLRTHSIGFIPTKWVYKGDTLFAGLIERALREWPEFTPDIAEQTRGFITNGIMLENSVVPIPSNTDALIQEVIGKGFDSSLIKSLGITDKDLETDAPKIIEIEGKKYTIGKDGTHYLYTDPSEENNDDQDQDDQEPHVIVLSTPVRVIKTPDAPSIVIPTPGQVGELVKRQIELERGKI